MPNDVIDEMLAAVADLIVAEGPADKESVMVDLQDFDIIPAELTVNDRGTQYRCLLEEVQRRGGFTLIGWTKYRFECTYRCFMKEATRAF